MDAGSYIEQVTLRPIDTVAQHLTFHGGHGGLVLPAGFDGTLLSIQMSVLIKDLDLTTTGGTAIALTSGTSELEGVRVFGGSTGISIGGTATLKDVQVENATNGITLAGGSHLNLERAVIRGGSTGVLSQGDGAMIQATNVLVFHAAQMGLDLGTAVGSVAFSTVAYSGANTGTGPRAVVCNQNLIVRESIVWAPGASARAPIAGCNLLSTIAGPTAVVGAPNNDPMFVDPANDDFHLSSASPAVDQADAGPSMDFERGARPRGVRYDLGADETE